MSDIEITVKCDGPCEQTGKTLFPIEVDNKTLLCCMDCCEYYEKEAKDHNIKVDRDRRKRGLIKNSGLPNRLSKVVMDDFVVVHKILSKIKGDDDKPVYNKDHIKGMIAARESALKIIETILGGDNVMVVFSGNNGTGKTMLEGIIMRQLLQASKKCRFCHAKQLLASLADINAYQDIIIDMASNDLTVIDDLTNVPETDFTVRAMSDIVNTLYVEERSLIISTNYLIEDVKNFIGEGGFDRLKEGSVGGVINFKWPSFRGLKIG